MLRVRLRIGDGGRVSAGAGVIFGDGVGETRLTSLLLSNMVAAASSHVGIGGSCFTGGEHGVVFGDGVGGTRLASLLLSNTAAAASSHVGIGGSCFTSGGHGVVFGDGVGGTKYIILSCKTVL